MAATSSVAVHHRALRVAAEVGGANQLLDVGCGTGIITATSRKAER
jgi:hypothetical protein